MSPAAVDRGRRMAEAAYLGANFLGDLGNAPELLDAVRESDPVHAGSLAGAMAAAYHLLNGVGDVDTAHRLLVGAIETCADPSDANNEVLVEAIYNLFGICFCGGRAELWEPFDRALGRLTPRPPELLGLIAETLEDPARRAAPALGRLDELIAQLSHESSPAQVIRVAIACGYSDRIPEVRSALRRLVDEGRDGGVITFSIQGLALLGMDAYLTGQWDEVEQLTDEAVQLCDAHGYVLRRWPHRSTQAMLAAGRGDREAARAITDEVLQWAVPRRAKQLQFAALHAGVLDSLAGGDFERAYQDVCAISPAGTIASHVPQAMWVVMDLVEAAVRTGRREEAVAHVEAARDANLGLISSRLALLTEGAAGIAAIELDGSFEKALAIPGAELWAFDLARVELAYGERLRRAKETAESSHAPRRCSRRVRAPRGAPLGAAGSERAARHRHHHWTPAHHWTRSVVAAATRDRTTRSRGTEQQGDRRAPVPLTPDGRLTPLPDLPKARDHLACRAPGCTRGLYRRLIGLR